MNSEKRTVCGCRPLVLGALCLCAGGVLAGNGDRLYGYPPRPNHAWAIHDWNRPNPPKVLAPAGGIPSDAVVLFDGTEESMRANWCDKDGKPTKWIFRNGAMESVRKAGYIFTKRAFGDCQLHIEWRAPEKVEGMGQGRGNSGVFLMGNYEVQVLDSWETDPAQSPNPNPNYADGQAGAIYGQNPPLVNAARKPGEWQTYDIVFHQPLWDGNKMLEPGTITVIHNGVLIQDDWPLEGGTEHRIYPIQKGHAQAMPLKLQDHGNPVLYRNVWIREIPSRRLNATHGGRYANAAAARELARQTAAALEAKRDKNATGGDAVRAALCVAAYAFEEPYVTNLRKLAADYDAFLAKATPAQLEAEKDIIKKLAGDFDMLDKAGFAYGDIPLAARVRALKK